jgi:hypothetical protein
MQGIVRKLPKRYRCVKSSREGRVMPTSVTATRLGIALCGYMRLERKWENIEAT